MDKFSRFRSGLGLVCLLVAGTVQSQQLRWEDENGVIYYREVHVTDATAIPGPAAAQNSSKKAGPATTKPATTKPDVSKARPAQLTATQKARHEQLKQQARQQKQCDRLQARLRKVNQKLDEGYREPQGNRLRRQRRELSSQLFQDCR